jgi:hypothetical protein
VKVGTVESRKMLDKRAEIVYTIDAQEKERRAVAGPSS